MKDNMFELTEEEIIEVNGGMPVWVVPAIKAIFTGVLAGGGLYIGETIYDTVKNGITSLIQEEK